MPFKRNMKYIRKVMAVGLSIIFLIALVIGTGVILSVRNVNVSFIEYTGEYKEEYEATRANFNKLKGSGLLFIDGDDIYGKVAATDVLVVESYEKKFPCTVNIVLRERVESFTVKNGDGYAVYDDRGQLIRNTENEPLNTVDGAPNVALECSDEDIEEIAALCLAFKENFFEGEQPKALRRVVESVATGKLSSLQVVNFNLRSGLKITVHDWKISGAQKVKKACEVYSKLNAYERIKGTITVIGGKDSAGPVAKYGE